MKKDIQLNRQLKNYFRWPMIYLVFLFILTLIMFYIDIAAGIISAIFFLIGVIVSILISFFF